MVEIIDLARHRRADTGGALQVFQCGGAHRAKRSKAITASPLDEIPGIGPARKRALLLHFGTASKVRAAALEDLQRAPGVSETVARKIYDFYHAGG